MAAYLVGVPVIGYATILVEAGDEKSAIADAMADDKLSLNNLAEWFFVEHIMTDEALGRVYTNAWAMLEDK